MKPGAPANGITRRRLLQAGGATAGGALLGACTEDQTVNDGDYRASIASLAQHETPDWFRDARFGVFIHWGLYSLPAYAPDRSTVPSDMKPGGHNHFKYNAYAEWYMNSLLFEDGPTAAYHREHYGSRPYSAFADEFNAMLEHWDPEEWARSIARSGARYLVLVTKHHDGFTLWPSALDNPHFDNWGTRRDVVGELAEAARGQGMKFGVYYSGGIDWSFKHRRIDSFAGLMLTMPSGGSGYLDYANGHYRELIERYRPDYLWNDISYPSEKAALEIAAHYYNTIDNGLINDRWIAWRSLLRPRAWRRPEGISGLLPPEPPAWDVRTPEYAIFDRILPFDWESTRGIGHSFGYNAQETEADMLSAQEIIRTLALTACRNGNLLLNIGPRGDGTLDPAQMSRMHAVGRWLSSNGDSLQDTRPVALSQSDIGGIQLGATRSNNSLFLHLAGTPAPGTYRVQLPVASNLSAARLRGDSNSAAAQLDIEDDTLVMQVSAWPEAPTQIVEISEHGAT